MTRPRLRTVLLSVNVVVLLLPLAGIALLRLYENELVQHTEAELVAQGAVIRAWFKAAVLQEISFRSGPPAAERPGLDYGVPVGALWAGPEPAPDDLSPIEPVLNLRTARVFPPAPDARPTSLAPDPAADAAGGALTPALVETRRATLCGIRVVDFRGTVVASSAGEVGMSLSHRDEVRRALEGETVSVFRERRSDEPAPALSSLSRGARVRVFVVLPVTDQSRILGAVVLSRTPLDPLKALYRNREFVMAALAAMAAIVILLSFFTTWAVARPLHALMRQSEKVAAGDRAAGAPLVNPVTLEVEQLSNAIARMARALEDRADYIRTFSSHVSHEFKTPLSSMQGSIEILCDHLDTMSAEERSRFLDHLQCDVNRLKTLVERLLDLARADVTKPTDGRTDVAAALETLAERWRARGVSVAVRAHGELGEIRMAPEVFDAVVGNLLDNARQHGGPLVSVDIEARNGGDPRNTVAVITVEDDGPGISEENVRKVMTPFFTTARDRGGTGLGLSIVSSLLAAHGGSITPARSSRGARFVVTIPAG